MVGKEVAYIANEEDYAAVMKAIHGDGAACDAILSSFSLYGFAKVIRVITNKNLCSQEKIMSAIKEREKDPYFQLVLYESILPHLYYAGCYTL